MARAAIQERVRDELPKLFVPRATPNVAPALQHYEFRAEDESEGIALALNSFYYYTKRYEGYATFRHRFGHFYRMFSDEVHIHKLNRAGLRYINHIPVLRPSPESAVPLADYLNVGIKVPAPLAEANLTELNSVFTIRLDQGSLRLLLKLEKLDEPGGREVLVLDFDFGQSDGLAVDRVDHHLDVAHTHTKRIFLELISERYLPVMRSPSK
jgi:uncharacterized protein (TIGR04255 family)